MDGHLVKPLRPRENWLIVRTRYQIGRAGLYRDIVYSGYRLQMNLTINNMQLNKKKILSLNKKVFN